MGKKNKAGVGHGILKARSRGTRGSQDGQDTWRHTSELNDAVDWKRLNISSITEQSALDDFLATAELAGTEFTAEKLNVSIVTPSRNEGVLSAEERIQIQQAQDKNKTLLRIPRRPAWTTSTSAQELDLKERDSFIEWRRQLASLQEEEHIILTPFEKNIEFWRQLWRVIERSDVIVQIVDARNPMLFRCQDLDAYVKEVNPEKENLLLINKADYLTQSQRSVWEKYFKDKGIAVAFWSALEETERLEKENENACKLDGDESQGDSKRNDSDDDSSDDSDEEQSRIDVTSRFAELSTKENQTNADPELTQKPDKQKEQIYSGPDNNKETDQHREQTYKQTDKETQQQGEQTNKPTDQHTGQHNEQTVKHTDKETQQHRKQTDKQTDKETQQQGEQTNKQTDQHTRQHNEQTVKHTDKETQQHREQTDKQTDTPSDGERATQNALDCSGKLLGSDELIELCQYLHHRGSQGDKPTHTTIGMVGYPNVGKSSTINAILQHKKVSVSATPGRTKHFQTLNLGEDVCLCDCPGLVFPSFVSTKAEMVVNGILPIDQMRDHLPPVTLVCQRIPREVLEAVYGVNIEKPREGEDPNRPPHADELLNAYGYMRGYMTAHGTPDCPRSSRYILKDYVMGKLLYCNPPPGVDAVHFQDGRFATGRFTDLEEVLEKRRIDAEKKGTHPKMSSVDEDFFAKKEVRHFVKGIPVMLPGQPGEMTSEGMVYKPWKKHNNKNKREKLRRLEKKSR